MLRKQLKSRLVTNYILNKNEQSNKIYILLILCPKNWNFDSWLIFGEFVFIEFFPIVFVQVCNYFDICYWTLHFARHFDTNYTIKYIYIVSQMRKKNLYLNCLNCS